MPNILFICHANRFRSVLAAEYFRKLLENEPFNREWSVGSAGIWAKEGVPPLREAKQFAAEKDFCVDNVRSREISTQLVTEADLIVVMEESQREAISVEFPHARDKTCLLSVVALNQQFDIPDPVISPDEDPNVIAEEIITIINSGFARILSRVNTRNKT